MVFIKGSYIYDVRKKVENSDVIGFVFVNAENIYNSRKYKLTGKQTDVTQAEFCGILLCRQCLNYKTKLEKKFKGYISEIVRRQTIFESAK